MFINKTEWMKHDVTFGKCQPILLMEVLMVRDRGISAVGLYLKIREVVLIIVL